VSCIEGKKKYKKMADGIDYKKNKEIKGWNKRRRV
jgi:hypothetical protein